MPKHTTMGKEPRFNATHGHNDMGRGHRINIVSCLNMDET